MVNSQALHSSVCFAGESSSYFSNAPFVLQVDLTNYLCSLFEIKIIIIIYKKSLSQVLGMAFNVLLLEDQDVVPEEDKNLYCLNFSYLTFLSRLNEKLCNLRESRGKVSLGN